MTEPVETPAADGGRADGADEFVGAEIRALRNARDITLKQLAAETGLSIGYLSQIERGISSPTVDVLKTIAQALGVTIGWFFRPADETETGERNLVVRAGRRRRLTFRSGITDELLSPTLDRTLELLLCTFPAGSESGEAPYRHVGEEAGVVISGRMEMWVGDRHFVLEEGDSFQFESHEPHRYRNPGERDAVVIWAITPPSY